jgi:hypothetical protein
MCGLGHQRLGVRPDRVHAVGRANVLDGSALPADPPPIPSPAPSAVADDREARAAACAARCRRAIAGTRSAERDKVPGRGGALGYLGYLGYLGG